MTPVELTALDIIRDSIVATGCAPTLDELARRLGWSSRSNAHRIVDALVRQGMLDREPNKARNLTLPSGPALGSVPTEALAAELERRGQGIRAALLNENIHPEAEKR